MRINKIKYQNLISFYQAKSHNEVQVQREVFLIQRSFSGTIVDYFNFCCPFFILQTFH